MMYVVSRYSREAGGKHYLHTFHGHRDTMSMFVGALKGPTVMSQKKGGPLARLVFRGGGRVLSVLSRVQLQRARSTVDVESEGGCYKVSQIFWVRTKD